MRIRPWKELQEKLPPLSRYELKELETSIRDHGVLQEILVLPDGRIIDGHHRWKLMDRDVPYRILWIDEEVGFALGLALNIGRRQITPEQFKNIRSLISDRRDKFVEVALELRRQGKSQREVGEILGIPRRTISRWENISNGHVAKAYIPDLRTSVPKKEQPKIYERAKKGESQAEIAADYKISQPRVSQVIKWERQKEKHEVPELPSGEYNVILADPPWRYDYSPTPNRRIENQYPTMALDDIKDISIPCSEESILFLWAPMPPPSGSLGGHEKLGVRVQDGHGLG